MFNGPKSPRVASVTPYNQYVKFVENKWSEGVRVVLTLYRDMVKSHRKCRQSRLILIEFNNDWIQISEFRDHAFENTCFIAINRVDVHKQALFAPCTRFSLNLVCVHAFSVKFIGKLEGYSRFLSVSTHHWEDLIQMI